MKLSHLTRWLGMAAVAVFVAACSESATEIEAPFDAPEPQLETLKQFEFYTPGALPDWNQEGLYLANGDNVLTFTGGASSPCGINTGIAFDGTNLIMSCWSHNRFDLLSTVDGTLLGTIPVGAGGYGAIAWDDNSGTLWACSLHSTVVQIDLDTQTILSSFGGAACTDGLAYDGSDNTLWTSGDVHRVLNHWNTDGTLIAAHNIGGNLNNYGSSGIATGGANLYLANNGGSQIFEVAKDFSSYTYFAGFPRRIEDLECDDVTFAPNNAVIWQQDAYDRVINAFEIPAGACPFGGGGDPEPNVAPTADASATVAIVECTGAGGDITLDGSASLDSDGNIVSWDWTDSDGNPIGSGETLTASFAHGTHDVTLTVTDDAGATSSTTITVEVEDTTAPDVSFSLDVTEIWPPNHKMVTVASGISASDVCNGAVSVSIEVTSNEDINGTGDGNTDYDWAVIANDDGTWDVQVRAERDGGGTGRIYTITVTATDSSGNSSTPVSGDVTVPHDQSKGKGKG